MNSCMWINVANTFRYGSVLDFMQVQLEQSINQYCAHTSRPESWPTLSAVHRHKQNETMKIKHKTDEHVSPVNGLEPQQSDRQKQTTVEDKIFWKGRFWAQSKTVKK